MADDNPIWTEICQAVHKRDYEKLLSIDFDQSECGPHDVCIKSFRKDKKNDIAINSIDGKIIDLLMKNSYPWTIEHEGWTINVDSVKKYDDLPKAHYNGTSSSSSWVIRDEKNGMFHLLTFVWNM